MLHKDNEVKFDEREAEGQVDGDISQGVVGNMGEGVLGDVSPSLGLSSMRERKIDSIEDPPAK
jgi:hypothetical protein